MTDLDYSALAQAAAARSEAASRGLIDVRKKLRAHEIALEAVTPARAIAAGKPITEAAAEHARLSSELHFMQEAVSYAEQADREARAAHTRADAELQRPAFNAARERRLAAAIAADKARADLAAAETEHAAATHEIQRVHARGLPRPFDGAFLLKTPIDEVSERALWENVQ